MSEALRESASAFLDGEQAEMEFHRLLKHADSGDVTGWMARQYTVRALIANEREMACPPAVQRAILSALADEPAHGSAPAETTPVVASTGTGAAWLKPFAGFAVAASVCAAVVFGINGLPGSDLSNPAAGGAAVASASSLPELGPTRSVTAVGAGNLRTVGFGAAAESTVAAEGNARAAERMNFYLRQHAERASLNNSQGMMPMARVVDFREQQ